MIPRNKANTLIHKKYESLEITKLKSIHMLLHMWGIVRLKKLYNKTVRYLQEYDYSINSFAESNPFMGTVF